MAEYPLLKNFIDKPLVGQIADRIATVQTDFARDAFVAATVGGLDELELKQRFAFIADKLREYLPAEYPAALAILVDILAAETGRFEPIDGADFRLLPIPAFVERHGLAHPQESLDAIYIITRQVTCEAAIRPYIIHHRELTFARLHEWARDDNEHVRRLVSEGSRPRLPWSPPLREIIADPSPTLALLEQLKDDKSLYVRRSVANHWNDISKDHPQLLLERMREWSEGASTERRWLINHALRTLVKQGDKEALAILGYGRPAVEMRDLRLSPVVLHFGGELTFSFSLHSRSQSSQALMVDFVMHFVKANGKTAPKVFKLKKLRLKAGETATITKKVAIRPISTRRYYPGRQRLEIQVNGHNLGGADFELVMQE